MDVDTLCDGFYHVKHTPEALIARLETPSGETLFCESYRNETMRACAETFMIRDRRVLEAIDSSGERGCTLHMYLTQNPCHFSSSNSTESCVEKLLLYRRDHLAPRHAALRIHATYPYRAHWDEAHMSEDDLAGRGAKSGADERREAITRARRLLANAREGTRRLVESRDAGVSLDAFSPADWAFVLSRCAPRVADAHAAGTPPFDAETKALRLRLDAFTGKVFASFRSSPPPNPSAARPASNAPGGAADACDGDGASELGKKRTHESSTTPAKDTGLE